MIATFWPIRAVARAGLAPAPTPDRQGGRLGWDENLATRSKPKAAVAVCVLAVLLAGGCTSTVNGAGENTATSGPASVSPAATTRTSAPTSAAALGAKLQSIAIQNSDLSSGYRMRLMPGGNQVIDQVTLDNCGFDFTTEAHRVARRQYNIVTPAGAESGLSNELVAYDTPGQAAKALTQWHTSAATCPHTPVHSSVAGVPALIMKVKQNRLDVPTLPVTHNAITVESGTARGQGTLYNMSIFQVHGRYLDAVYLTIGAPLTTAETSTAQQLATITGRRLAALS